MIRELECVVLARDLEAHGLKEGDVGAVVHCYPGGSAFEVEFVTGEGRTIAVVTLEAKDVRPVQSSEILHVRTFATA
jgi:hypothetical protein